MVGTRCMNTYLSYVMSIYIYIYILQSFRAFRQPGDVETGPPAKFILPSSKLDTKMNRKGTTIHQTGVKTNLKGSKTNRRRTKIHQRATQTTLQGTNTNRRGTTKHRSGTQAIPEGTNTNRGGIKKH